MFTKNKPQIVASGIDRVEADIILPVKKAALNWEKLMQDGPYEVAGLQCAFTSDRSARYALRRLYDLVVFDPNRRTKDGLDILSVVAGSLSCAIHGTKNVLRAIGGCAHSTLGNGAETKVNRVDLFIDLQNTSRPTEKVLDQIVCLARKTVGRTRYDVVTDDDEPMASLMLGDQNRSDTLLASYYEKPRMKLDDWRRMNWELSNRYTHDAVVRRLEFRVWGSSKFAALGVDPDPAKLANGGLNSMWEYLTGTWMKVLSRAKSKTRRKNEVHRWWKLIQKQVPLKSVPTLPRDYREPREEDLELAVSQAAGYLRRIAGLGDSVRDRELAKLACIDAAKRLMRPCNLPEPWDVEQEFDLDSDAMLDETQIDCLKFITRRGGYDTE